MGRTYPMTFKTLGATAPTSTRPQTEVLKLVGPRPRRNAHDSFSQGDDIYRFLRETLYIHSLVKRYINISRGFPCNILNGKSILFRDTPWESPRRLRLHSAVPDPHKIRDFANLLYKIRNLAGAPKRTLR